MIQDVDESLRNLIRRDALAGTDVEVLLDAPTREWSARRNSPTLDMYLYDIREDLRRRENGLIDVLDEAGHVKERRRPPRYYKLSYLVTAWTQRPEDEHRLLSAVLLCLLRHDHLPLDVLAGRLAGSTLPIAVTVALPPPEDRALSDVWSALWGRAQTFTGPRCHIAVRGRPGGPGGQARTRGCAPERSHKRPRRTGMAAPQAVRPKVALRKAVAARSVTSRAHLRVAKRDRRQWSAGQATKGAAFFGSATPPMRPVTGTMLLTAAGIDERTGRGHGLVDVLRPGPSRTGQSQVEAAVAAPSQSRPQARRPVPRRLHRRPGNRPSPEPTRGSPTTAAARPEYRRRPRPPSPEKPKHFARPEPGSGWTTWPTLFGWSGSMLTCCL